MKTITVGIVFLVIGFGILAALRLAGDALQGLYVATYILANIIMGIGAFVFLFSRVIDDLREILKR